MSHQGASYRLVGFLVQLTATSGAGHWRTGVLLIALLTLVACTTPDADNRDVSQAFDPFEEENRRTHEFNKSIDRALLRPAGRGYQTIVPIPVQAAVGNFSSNLSMPGVAVNSLLQGDLGGTGLAIVRFAMNSTIGIGGLIDAADEFNVPDHDTDFGETLHVWGAPEGAFIELPFLGPSTERDATGRFVDLFTNPLAYVVSGSDQLWGYGAAVASSVSDRGRFSETIDFILYESADSYAQSRLIYIQNRRFELGQGSENDGTDPYSDPYDDFYSDPYDDPYEDPYAE